MYRNADCILLDPLLLDDFNSIKYGIPFYKTQKEFLVLVKNDVRIKFGDYKIKTFSISEDDFNEKTFLVSNFKNIEKNIGDDGCIIFYDKFPTRVILDFILIKALLENVSDVHFDLIDSSKYIVRFKIDTVLNKYFVLTKEQGDAVFMRLKVLCSIDTSKKHIPHSASFFRNFRNMDVDFRVSTHPTFLGERCVIRILQQKNVVSIENIGLNEEVLNIAKKIIDYPFGFVIFTGPTNSGKTTDIHSILKEIANSGVNIMTLEDPVEYRIPGIVQTNISENGVSFFEGMKSILRQDPNVIFLGEIRDAQTAQIAIQAAMTGHKVLTTLHAYSIKGAISRLCDMGISLKMLAESLLAIFSQRLVRKLNSEDKTSYKGLVLVADAFYFDEDTKDILRASQIPNIENKLPHIGQKMIEDGLTTKEEIKRVIG